jgi:hypothetical protein
MLQDEIWLRKSSLVGIDMNEEKQIEFLNQVLKFKNEYDSFPKNKTPIPWQYHLNNSFFGAVDAEILYSMIRYFKPRKMIEIGSGYSTFLSAQAILKNEEEIGTRAELVVIDPYPNDAIRSGFSGLSKLIIKKAQEVDFSIFDELGRNDILFIDTSHVLKIGGDVQHEYLEILPRLNRGVIVHIHDVFLPIEYPKEWVLRLHFFWNEQYLLQAFLAFNDAFEVLWAGGYMHLRHSEKLEKAFNSYNPKTIWKKDPVCGATSFWIRRR